MEEILARFPQQKPTPQSSITQKHRYALTPVDVEVLKALADLRFMMTDQLLCYWGLSQNSLPKLQHKLKLFSGNTPALSRTPYLQRSYQARYTPRGSLSFYAVNIAGKHHLQSLGFDVKHTACIRTVTKRLPSDITHHLAINEFFIVYR